VYLEKHPVYDIDEDEEIDSGVGPTNGFSGNVAE
jgi:hypothetical protein